jgi:hypothetical protein
MNPTVPSEDHKDFALELRPSVEDERTGAFYVHKDYTQYRNDWEDEAHVEPVKASESFGDVESWAAYVKRYASAEEAFSLLTWNSAGLKATLDYHGDINDPGRCQWTACQPFTKSPEWRAWETFASGQPVSQRIAIERLEDLGEDITDPPETALTQMLRDLRANATARADTEIRPDGTAAVSFTKDTSVSNKAGTLELPPVITVAIPVLVGDTTRYAVRVRMRISVTDDAKLAFRFSLVNAERILETVYAERVQAAKTAVGTEYEILRAAG